MNFNEYEDTVLKHAFYPNRGNNLQYATLGLTGEAGEVANIVKKVQRDDSGVITDEKRLKILDELGDVLWYTSATADEVGFSLEDVAAYNIKKLAERHGTNDKGEVTNSIDKFGGLKFRVGDRVRIIARNSGHRFPLGTEGIVVELFSKSQPPYYRVAGDFQDWYLDDSELELGETVQHIRAKPFPNGE